MRCAGVCHPLRFPSHCNDWWRPACRRVNVHANTLTPSNSISRGDESSQRFDPSLALFCTSSLLTHWFQCCNRVLLLFLRFESFDANRAIFFFLLGLQFLHLFTENPGTTD